MVALRDADPGEWRQPFSFRFTALTPSQTLFQVARILALLPEASRSEMASGALQLSLVVLDADPLECRQSLSASCSAPTLSKNVVTHLDLSFPPKLPLSCLVPKTSRCNLVPRSSQVRVTHELGGLDMYMHIVYG